MLNYVFKRLLGLIPTLLIVAVLVFLFVHLLPGDPAQKAKLYKDAQDIIWKESPWIPLVVEQLISAHNTRLTGFWIMPDTGFSFDDADLK